LIGAVIGAFIVNLAKSWFTVSFPEYWLFFLGTLFIVSTLWLPQGVVGLYRRLRAGRSNRQESANDAEKGAGKARENCGAPASAPLAAAKGASA
ncbi:MAG TPA: urea ABC transporter permease subunit UrtC, partial [Accumulibacter sp.]|nr:urea ABC transporter permease subunit UrtC [Accumulibacter sp.]